MIEFNTRNASEVVRLAVELDDGDVLIALVDRRDAPRRGHYRRLTPRVARDLGEALIRASEEASLPALTARLRKDPPGSSDTGTGEAE